MDIILWLLAKKGACMHARAAMEDGDHPSDETLVHVRADIEAGKVSSDSFLRDVRVHVYACDQCKERMFGWKRVKEEPNHG